jgi:hypothetical protein
LLHFLISKNVAKIKVRQIINATVLGVEKIVNVNQDFASMNIPWDKILVQLRVHAHLLNSLTKADVTGSSATMAPSVDLSLALMVNAQPMIVSQALPMIKIVARVSYAAKISSANLEIVISEYALARIFVIQVPFH